MKGILASALVLLAFLQPAFAAGDDGGFYKNEHYKISIDGAPPSRYCLHGYPGAIDHGIVVPLGDDPPPLNRPDPDNPCDETIGAGRYISVFFSFNVLDYESAEEAALDECNSEHDKRILDAFIETATNELKISGHETIVCQANLKDGRMITTLFTLYQKATNEIQLEVSLGTTPSRRDHDLGTLKAFLKGIHFLP